MSSRGAEHPLVERFRLEFGTLSAAQYAQSVQQFLKVNSVADPRLISADQLRDYIASKAGTTRARGRHVSALKAFYRDLHARREIPTDIAAELHEANRDGQLVESLRRAGLSTAVIEGLTWRDVLASGFGPKSPPIENIDPVVREPAIAALMEQFIRRLRADRKLDYRALLERTVF